MPSIKNVANAVKRAAAVFGPGQFEIAGKTIQCSHCGNNTFEKSEAQLNKSLSTLFELDWLDASATLLICTTCSQILWFGKQPDKK